ncbi:hypothetical protein [Limibacterium fermenti]|uniref:hypothetical protein n=1 Tax=Limibacterium fermenti TaxID=3229863 RepID=UPI000E7E7A49|nr:hypothetical protein [Porphyromonadaceae bacterium]HBX45571.1 hypothetical protein [Porphyromonadaceae bacterium]
MTTKDVNFNLMTDSVGTTLNTYKSVWAVNTRFTEATDRFWDIKNKINASAERSEIETSGATTEKKNVAFDAFDMAADLSKRGSIYALDNKNLELHDQLRVSRSSLSGIDGKQAIAKMRDIHTRLSALPPEGLAPYQITEVELTEFKGLIDAYEAHISRPRDITIDRAVQNQDVLPQLFTDMRGVLYVMDSLISIFKGTEFAMAYRQARKIMDRGKTAASRAKPSK